MFSNRNTNVLKTPSETRVLSAFMSSVYLWMMIGVTISGLTAYAVASRPEIALAIQQKPILFYGLIILQIGAVIAISGWIQSMSVGMASLLYASYATMVGLTSSVIFLIYTTQSIGSAFFLAAFAFAGLSAVGYTTKRDLGPIGSFCIMGLFGMIGIIILGMFIPSMMSNSMQLAISVIGILIFAGLTAYDTQRIKNLQFQYTTPLQARKGAIFGALILYLDFINLFLNILRLVGDRK